jgi:HAD superfamily hydrolase (TIGR01509 family)
MTAEFRGLLFDFDGTVAETERHGQRVAYNQAFAALGLDWHWDEELYRDLLSVAGGGQRLRYYLARYRPELAEQPATAGLIARIHQEKIRHFSAIASAIPFRPGIRRLIAEADHAGLAVAIVTTASRPGVEALLGQDPATARRVSLIAGNEVVERKKPAPDAYLWALDRLGLAPDEAVAVEDSAIGLTAALAAGIATLVTVSDYTGGEDFTGARAVLGSLGDPGAPCLAVRGPAPADGVVDLAYLRAIRHTD